MSKKLRCTATAALCLLTGSAWADHFGHDSRSRVLVRVEKGDWKLINAH